ncbi:MAG: DNA ligase D [Pseudomonadota bacterium]
MPGKTTEKLATYRAKRSADSTPEPFAGGWPVAGGNLFVVQQHHAQARHYDLRLEMAGVLVSWAVPKGPSPNSSTKRFAVQTEDHPLEYANFEGVIPEGNYGAGTMIVWDQGRWEPLEDVDAGFEKGKLLFNLHGAKLHGRWTLIKTKRGEKDWLLIKERDRHVQDEDTDEAYPHDSVLSGLTVEQVAAGYDADAALGAQLAKASGAERRRVELSAVKPMLAEPAKPFSDPAWLFEPKLDGYRLLAAREGGDQPVVLRSRKGNDLTDTFPEVAFALSRLPVTRWLIDGEVVVNDARGLPSFALMQQRAKRLRRTDVRAASVRMPAQYHAFDLPVVGDFDLRSLPLHERKQWLAKLLPSSGLVRYTGHVQEAGEALYEQAQRLDLEGLMAKRADSPYVEGRSAHWRKLPVEHRADCLVLGYTDSDGAQSGFGALLLGQYQGDRLRYVGRVGTGFDGALRDRLAARLRTAAPLAKLPEALPPGAMGSWHWRSSDLICEVRHKQYSGEGRLRQPVFLRLREDKEIHECLYAGAGEPEQSAATTTDSAPSDAPTGAQQPAEVPVTNQDKVFWPEDGITKGQLVSYYDQIAPYLLPYLRDRPLVLTRYPDGIEGKSFFQKDAPAYAPPWLRRETLWSQHAEREINYFVAEDEQALRWIINLGTIPLHIWSSRLSHLAHPDWSIIDLDPKGAPFSDVLRIARFLQALCADVQLPAFVKTTGSTGLHILLPLGGQLAYEQSRTLAELLARITVAALPKIATITRAVERRQNKVYIDYLQNGHGRLLVAPYSVRPLPGAPVSMPLAWREVKGGLQSQRYTVTNALRRLRSLRVDPWADLLTEAPDLLAVLQRLGSRWEAHRDA